MAPRRAVLETDRLRLEPVTRRHAPGLYHATAVSRPELLPWMPWAREPSLESGRTMTAAGVRDWRQDKSFHFALVERASDEALGVAGFNREGADAAELFYWIRSDRAGRGLTTEACRALLAWAPALGVRRLTLWAGRDNAASRRVASKLGFEHLGPLGWRPEGGLGDFDAEAYELPLP